MFERSNREFSPTAEEELLFKALLLEGDSRRQAAAEWLERTSLPALNEGTKRLLPLFVHRLKVDDLENAILTPSVRTELNRHYRRYWAETLHIHYEAERTGDLLQQLGAPLVLLKGLALGKFAYQDPVLRPCADIDVLIPRSRIEAAQALLSANGYAVKNRSFHSTTFTKPQCADIDLHGSPYHEVFHQAHVEPLFSRLGPLDGSRFLRLSHEDQLLHTFSHGLRRNSVSPIRWIVDAVFLLRYAGSTFDWDQFCNEAARLDLEEVAYRGLAILSTLYPAVLREAPVAVLARRRTATKSLWFMAERQCKGPILVWARARRNFTAGECVRVCLEHYGNAVRRRVRAYRASGA